MINRPLNAQELTRLSKNLRAGSQRAARQGDTEMATLKLWKAQAYERRLKTLVVK